MFLKVDIVGAERMSSGVNCTRRPDQPHKMSGCRVAALSWVRTNRHGQQNLLTYLLR